MKNYPMYVKVLVGIIVAVLFTGMLYVGFADYNSRGVDPAAVRRPISTCGVDDGAVRR